MLKKSNATPYTIMESTNIHTPLTGIAHAEEPEAQYPCQHGNQHHLLDAEAFQEERYQQDAECFGIFATAKSGCWHVALRKCRHIREYCRNC